MYVKKLINFLRGNVLAELHGRYPERFINLCADNSLSFWGLEPIADDCIRLYISHGDLEKACNIATRLGYSLRIVRKSGVPQFVLRFRRRITLIGGIAAVAAFVIWSGLHIWRIEIYGNSTVSNSAILAALGNAGVAVGCNGLGIDSASVRNSVLLELDELLWLGVNVKGSTAEVIVRERVKRPDILDCKTPSYVISSKTGLVESISDYKGEAVCEVGDVLLQGETAVSGIYKTSRGEIIPRASTAELWLRTWYTLSASMPLDCLAKLKTGETSVEYTVILPGHSLTLGKNSGLSRHPPKAQKMRTGVSFFMCGNFCPYTDYQAFL